MQRVMIFLLLCLNLVSLGCSNQGIYEGIKQNQCREKTGSIYCDDGQSYEEYQRDREALIKKQPTQ